MTRRTPKPRAGLDWRAIAAPRPQRRLALPAPVEADTVAEAAPAGDADDVELRLQRDDAGLRLVLTGAAVWRSADAVRRFAARLLEGADALEGDGS